MTMRFTIPEAPKQIINTLRQHGFEAYTVGGCVRDSLLGLTPHDWDVCTSAQPEEIKACFSQLETNDVGIAHGTVMVILHHQPYEVTTYRIDGDTRTTVIPKASPLLAICARILRGETSRSTRWHTMKTTA